MAILKIVEYGDPRLRQPTERVQKISAKIKRLVADMFDTMYANNGVGLAAPQVGELKKLFVLDCSTDDAPLPQMVMINPVLARRSGAIYSKEGCLSFPGVYTDVKRYANVTVRFMDLDGRRRELTVEGGGLLCRAIQHEYDHLEGVLFVDHVVDRFTTDAQLQEHRLPPIDPQRILEEPDLDRVLMGIAPDAPPPSAAL
ncbi:MAG: peptide deformylase [Vampirovibrionales bacterium]|nr:peptide deformylase [Vampirovibrionales bacterium]